MEKDKRRKLSRGRTALRRLTITMTRGNGDLGGGEGGLEGLESFNMWVTKLDQRAHIIGKVEGCETEFLLDTGATLSLLNFTPRGSRTKDRILIHRVMGQKEQNVSKP